MKFDSAGLTILGAQLINPLGIKAEGLHSLSVPFICAGPVQFPPSVSGPAPFFPKINGRGGVGTVTPASP